jgi:hypothetical protein
MRDAGIVRATERLALACKALAAAANDLIVARDRDELPVSDAADEVSAEVERVCELAHELERRASELGTLAGARS